MFDQGTLTEVKAQYGRPPYLDSSFCKKKIQQKKQFIWISQREEVIILGVAHASDFLLWNFQAAG